MSAHSALCISKYNYGHGGYPNIATTTVDMYIFSLVYRSVLSHGSYERAVRAH
jgi:hypothetical protein